MRGIKREQSDDAKHDKNSGLRQNHDGLVGHSLPDGLKTRGALRQHESYDWSHSADSLMFTSAHPYNDARGPYMDYDYEPFNKSSSSMVGNTLPQYSTAPSQRANMTSPNHFSYPPLDNMSAIHESQPYMAQERDFHQLGADPREYDHQHVQQRYPSPPAPPSENPYIAQHPSEVPADVGMDLQAETKSESDAPSPGRSKPVPKPDREVTKDANGRYYCNWPNCTDETQTFGRKCEWSKHMDKHDRPYKCDAEGCEKLPGFTYSGGLLRHEREVHNKHGGPKKQLNCPHTNCKRHVGKGFSRQENLNEHLRRVHTEAGAVMNGEDTEDDGPEDQTGQKRKRASGTADSIGLHEEIKRVKQENEDLRRQVQAQNARSEDMLRQIQQLQQAQQMQVGMHPRMQAPPAQMI